MTDYITSTFLLCPSDTYSIHLYTALAILQPRFALLAWQVCALAVGTYGKRTTKHLTRQVRPQRKTVQTDYTGTVNLSGAVDWNMF